MTLVIARFTEFPGDWEGRLLLRQAARIASESKGLVGQKTSLPWAATTWHITWWRESWAVQGYIDKCAGLPEGTLWWSEPGLLPDLKTARHMVAELRKNGPSSLVFGDAQV